MGDYITLFLHWRISNIIFQEIILKGLYSFLMVQIVRRLRPKEEVDPEEVRQLCSFSIIILITR